MNLKVLYGINLATALDVIKGLQNQIDNMANSLQTCETKVSNLTKQQQQNLKKKRKNWK